MTTVRIAAHQEEASKMEAQVRTSRKRANESSSSDQPDIPKPKKKKAASKGKPAADPVLLAVPSLPPPSTSPPQPESTLAHSKPGPSSQAAAETQAPLAAAEVAPKKKATPKNKYLKPQRNTAGSWKTHIASLVVHRCVRQADSRGIDPRSHLSDINWSRMVEGLLKPEDMQMIWYYIHREYPDGSLTSILDCTKPYSDLSLDKLLKEEIKLKYKDQLPKPPLTPYMLFMQSKLPKLKRKYPDLQMTEVASKLGKKWKTIGQERQERYKQQHVALKAAYEAQLQKFYEEHPDAKPPPPTKPKKSSRGAATGSRGGIAGDDSDETRRIGELRAQMPKQPMSAYLCFCKKKREKLHRKHPELSPNEVTVKLGKRWQTMGEEARAKYVKLHDQSVMNYKEQMAQFHANYPNAKELIAKARKLKRKLPRSLPKQHAVHEVPLPPPAVVTLPPPEGVSNREEGEGEGEGEQEEEEAEAEEEGEEEEEEEGSEELLTDHKQNGTENLDDSGSESDSSDSSTDN